jgi:hypothetical protein
MHPDLEYAEVVYKGKPMSVREAIRNDHWLRTEFVPFIQNRGQEVHISPFIASCDNAMSLSARRSSAL